MIRGSLRGWGWAAVTASLLAAASCGPAPTPKCQSSNCSGCCTEDNVCLGSTRQSFNACGSGAARCRTCLPQQICSQLRCVDGSGGGDGGGTGSTGGGSGGGDAGGSGGSGGGATCGSTGQACCVGSGSGCLLGLFCVNNTCSTTSGTGGGSAGGSGGGGTGGGSGGGAGGGMAGGAGGAGGGAGGGAAGALGDPCVVNSNCSTNYCQAIGFQNGYCTRTCTSQVDCPSGSKCSRNPGGGGNVCLQSCAMPGVAPGGCRAGYVCEKYESSMDGTPVCFPACSSAANCAGAALVCDSRGFCCGANTAACCNTTTCDSPNTCDSVTRHCKSLPATGRPVGEACTTPGNCAGNTCVAELANSPPACSQVCFSGGYCTQNCDGGVCPSGSSCSPYTFSTTGKWCVANCVWDGGQGDCRTNYVCDRNLIPGSSQATCFKSCFADAGCASNTACDRGFCCGKPGFRCCSGATKCPGGGTCNATDYCQ